MTLLAISQGEGHVIVAETAVLLRGDLEHGVFCRALLDAREDIRMAEFTSVPEGMLLVGKDDVRHPEALRCNGKVLLHIQWEALYGYAGKKVNRPYEPPCLGRLPIDEIRQVLFRQLLREGGIVVFFLDVLPHGMTPVAPCTLFRRRTQ